LIFIKKFKDFCKRLENYKISQYDFRKAQQKSKRSRKNAKCGKNAANTPVKCKKSFLSIFYVTKYEKSIFFT